MLSSSCRYGIRAGVYLAAHEGVGEAYISIRIISEDLHISFHFLTKVMQKLTQDGIIASYRGPHGGVALARPPDQISVLDVVRSIDGDGLFSGCILGLPRCNDKNPCALHAEWVEERKRLLAIFKGLTLADLDRGPAWRL